MNGTGAERVRWVLAGGGTGGHVTLALALGEEIARCGDPVLFVGSERGLEAKLVAPAGFELVTLAAQPLAGRGPAAKLGALLAFARATRAAIALLRRRRIDVVLSVGGYAAAPAAAAAIALRRPLAIVEPNAVPGRTNLWMARLAQRVFTAFAAAEPAFAGRAPVETTGAPLRRALLEAFAAAAPRRTPAPPFRLLVVGGSQGARQLNDAMLAALPGFDPARLEVYHQTGPADRARVAEAYARAGLQAEVVDFDAALASRYQWADVALCRAGALTVAELAMAGLPALLVPYPHAADDHQRANARALEEAGAGRLLDPARFDAKLLVEALDALFERPAALLEMGRRARALARPDAARRIVEAARALPGAGREA
ncbi:MAG: undecaprenyldiphospho-muramoylpentapeptide beta-N-acetylglucosaminyltransferase [Deltaproteobacteria bacterium]|nr:undecaprenyldiphospho-muramoylpentapeptide beta-N-acetylglucosaminyltransferase [Deltaproteobacteria bacterium]